jgi:hypothetical protein
MATTPCKVLVIFHCRTGATEKLALAAAVGAVQGRAIIRLRRLQDGADAEIIDSSPDHAEELQRMRKEYVPPTEADALWADGIIFGTGLKTCAEYLDLLSRLRSEGKLTGKVGAVVCGEIESEMATLGFSAPPLPSGAGVERAVDLGRNVAAAARERLHQMGNG